MNVRPDLQAQFKQSSMISTSFAFVNTSIQHSGLCCCSALYIAIYSKFLGIKSKPSSASSDSGRLTRPSDKLYPKTCDPFSDKKSASAFVSVYTNGGIPCRYGDVILTIIYECQTFVALIDDCICSGSRSINPDMVLTFSGMFPQLSKNLGGRSC